MLLIIDTQKNMSKAQANSSWTDSTPIFNGRTVDTGTTVIATTIESMAEEILKTSGSKRSKILKIGQERKRVWGLKCLYIVSRYNKMLRRG